MDKDFGFRGAVDYLARLLKFAIRDNAEEVAQGLVQKYGRIDLIASAREDDLLLVPGMTRAAVTLLKITSAVTSRRITDSFNFGRVHSEIEITDYLVGLYHGVAVETVYMLILDGAGRTVSLKYMGEGTVGASDVYPRRLLEAAVKSRAAAVILAHNHPRGDGRPSKDDVYSTKKLTRLFASAGIELRDHYIVSERDVGKVELTEC